jgi:hypothetical protein
MAYENTEIIEREHDAILLMDRPTTNSWYEMYSGIPRTRSKAKRLAIMFPTRARAEAYLANEGQEYHNAAHVSVMRRHSFAAAPSRLRGYVMLYDRYSKVDDDAALKARHPVPDGIDVEYRWDAKDQVYRLVAKTERNGVYTTRTVVLHPADKDFADQIAAAYRRFVRTSPAPVNEPGVRCGIHVAKLLSRLERPAAAAYRTWLAKVRSLPLHDRPDAGRLVLPGSPLGDAIESVTLETVRGRDEISARILYKKGNAVTGSRLRIASRMPTTIVHAINGRAASALWGAAELSDVTVGKHRSTARTKEDGEIHEYEVSYRTVPAPDIAGVAGDEDRAEKVLDRNYAEYAFERTLSASFEGLPPTWLLHLVRSLRLSGADGVDVSFVTAAQVARLRLDGKTIRAESQETLALGTLWKMERRRAA